MDSIESMRPNHPLRRRNSIATSGINNPSPLSKPPLQYPPSTFLTGGSASDAATNITSSSSSSSVEFEFIPIRSLSYTSLKDLLLLSSSASAVQSPKSPAGVFSGYEISIRNRLVKQAAWAYLQPMSTLPDSSGRRLLHRLWARISGNSLFASFRQFLDRHIVPTMSRAFDWFLRAIRVRSSR